jgi:hypothetical protein
VQRNELATGRARSRPGQWATAGSGLRGPRFRQEHQVLRPRRPVAVSGRCDGRICSRSRVRRNYGGGIAAVPGLVAAVAAGPAVEDGALDITQQDPGSGARVTTIASASPLDRFWIGPTGGAGGRPVEAAPAVQNRLQDFLHFRHVVGVGRSEGAALLQRQKMRRTHRDPHRPRGELGCDTRGCAVRTRPGLRALGGRAAFQRVRKPPRGLAYGLQADGGTSIERLPAADRQFQGADLLAQQPGQVAQCSRDLRAWRAGRRGGDPTCRTALRLVLGFERAALRHAIDLPPRARARKVRRLLRIAQSPSCRDRKNSYQRA